MFRFLYLHSPVVVRRRVERNRWLFKLIDHAFSPARIDRTHGQRQEIPEATTVFSEHMADAVEGLTMQHIPRDDS